MVKVLGLSQRCCALQSLLRSVVRMASGVAAAAAGSGEEKLMWQKPHSSPPAPVLKVYNSLTRTKVSGLVRVVLIAEYSRMVNR